MCNLLIKMVTLAMACFSKIEPFNSFLLILVISNAILSNKGIFVSELLTSVSIFCNRFSVQ